MAKSKAKEKPYIPEISRAVDEYVEREIALLFQRALELAVAYNNERDNVRAKVMKAKSVTMEMITNKKVKDGAQYFEPLLLSVSREEKTGGLKIYWNLRRPKKAGAKNQNGYVRKGKTQTYSEKALRRIARLWNHANVINAELHAAELRTRAYGLMAIKKAIKGRSEALEKKEAACRKAIKAVGGRQIVYTV